VEHADALPAVDDVVLHAQVFRVGHRLEEVGAALAPVGLLEELVGLPAERIEVGVRAEFVGVVAAAVQFREQFLADVGREHREGPDCTGLSYQSSSRSSRSSP